MNGGMRPNQGNYYFNYSPLIIQIAALRKAFLCPAFSQYDTRLLRQQRRCLCTQARIWACGPKIYQIASPRRYFFCQYLSREY